ncbi:MAG TPA: winged helix-turn-helix domain-containing protein [Terriglobia bacterium]|nr:winged helix-turn-helix domain-containing protein [Terriglobia bacterium]
MPAAIIQFDEFELDLGRYELRRGGQALRLEKVPMELLILLAERQGQLATREEIIQKLWGDEVFVDTRQGINTAVRKLRLALRDDPDEPRIVQTVFGKGYRLVAPVTLVGAALRSSSEGAAEPPSVATLPGEQPTPKAEAIAVAASNPGPVNPRLARSLFLLTQTGYLALYAAAFVYFPNIRRLGLPQSLMWVTLVTGLVGAAVRLYLVSAVGFNFTGSRRLFRQLFPGILVLDALWAAAPLLLFNRLGELTLLFVAALAFLPFSQRTLMLWSYGPGGLTSADTPAREPRDASRLPAA